MLFLVEVPVKASETTSSQQITREVELEVGHSERIILCY